MAIYCGRPAFKGGGWVIRFLDRDDVRRLVGTAGTTAAPRKAFADVPPGDW
jgi:hypothetical protein